MRGGVGAAYALRCGGPFRLNSKPPSTPCALLLLVLTSHFLLLTYSLRQTQPGLDRQSQLDFDVYEDAFRGRLKHDVIFHVADDHLL